MCYNIERVVENADFTTDKIYEYIFDVISPNNVELLEENDYGEKGFRKIFVERANPTNSSSLIEAIQIYKGVDITFSGKDKQVKYTSKVPLYGCKVPNPSIPGANGLHFSMTKGLRVVVGSGILSSCSYAVLVSDDRIYVIHAGATALYREPISDYETHCKTLNKDIFNAFISLKAQISGSTAEILNDGIDDEYLAQKLSEHRAHGIIMSHAFSKNGNPMPDEPINYDTIVKNDMKTIFIKYANRARVYVIKNDKGDMSCLVRKSNIVNNVWYTAMFDNVAHISESQ